MNPNVLDVRRSRFTWIALLALVLVPVLLTGPRRTQAAPGGRQSVAVLIVCNGRNARQKSIEDRIVALIRQAMSDQDLPREALPILVYHYDKPSEAKYCQSALRIKPGELPFLGLATHQDLVVKQVILREPNVTDPEASVARLFTKAFKLITGTDLQTVHPTAPPPRTRTPVPTPSETIEPNTPGSVRIGQLVTCRSIHRPLGDPEGVTDVFGMNDIVYVDFVAFNLKVGSTVHVRWYQEDTLMGSSSVTSPRTGDLYVFFNRRPPWSPGRYHVDVYADGKFKARTYFRINGN